jgi:hypothetical protein
VIFFLTTRQNEYTIESYLRGYGSTVTGILWPMRYERFLRAKRLRAGTYVLADLELLTDTERERAAARARELADRGCRVLNHPTRSLRRFALLRTRYEHGQSRFNVYRLADAAAVERYPVFLRAENDHLGALTSLLSTPAELDAAVVRLRRTGVSLDATIIVEFADTADATGLYRKYSAFIVGDRIVPRHVFFSRDWHVKSWQLVNAELLGEELAYLDTNPHERELRAIFTAARIDYGRIDYGLAPGGLEVWEINTNPTIVWPSVERRPREDVHARFAAMLEPAWRELDGVSAAGEALRRRAAAVRFGGRRILRRLRGERPSRG